MCIKSEQIFQFRVKSVVDVHKIRADFSIPCVESVVVTDIQGCLFKNIRFAIGNVYLYFCSLLGMGKNSQIKLFFFSQMSAFSKRKRTATKLDISKDELPSFLKS